MGKVYCGMRWDASVGMRQLTKKESSVSSVSVSENVAPESDERINNENFQNFLNFSNF